MISKEIMSEHAMTGVNKIQAPAVLAIWTDVTAQAEAEFNEWYWREHVPERLGVPGFLRGSRYRAIEGAPRYFTSYDLESAAVLNSPIYLDRLNNPTTLTRRVMPNFRSMVRAVCNVVRSVGRGTGSVALTVRFSPRRDQRAKLEAAIAEDLLPSLHKLSGIVCVQYWRAEKPAASSTQEGMLRGSPDASIESAIVVGATS